MVRNTHKGEIKMNFLRNVFGKKESTSPTYEVTNVSQRQVATQSEILRFLTSERTKQYEVENDSYWSLSDMVLVIIKTGMHRDWGDVSVTDIVVDSLANLYRQGKLQLNPSFSLSKDIEANARFIHELQTETQPLFRAK
jgi:hypothetical protein